MKFNLRMQQEETEVFSIRFPSSLVQRLRQIKVRLNKLPLPSKQKPSIQDTLGDLILQGADELEAFLDKAEAASFVNKTPTEMSLSQPMSNGELK